MLTITALKKKYGLHVTTNHKDKMEGLSSFSTNPLCNELCKKRCNIPGSICEKCYSVTMQHRFDNLNKCLEKNDIIKSVIIPDCDLPILFSETGMFRFEAFGDITAEESLFCAVIIFIGYKCPPACEFAHRLNHKLIIF